MAGNCIIDDDVCQEAARQEIIRRYYNAVTGLAAGTRGEAEAYKIQLLMKQAKVTIADRKVVGVANTLAERTGEPAAALELDNGSIITGKTSSLLGSSAALLLNALKVLAGIDHKTHVSLIPRLASPPFKNKRPRRQAQLDAGGVPILLKLYGRTCPCPLIIYFVVVSARRPMDCGEVLYYSDDESTHQLHKLSVNEIKQLGVHLSFVPEDRLGMPRVLLINLFRRGLCIYAIYQSPQDNHPAKASGIRPLTR